MTGTIGKTLHTQKGKAINNQKGIFCEGIVENLISVGELCDSQHTVVFTNTHSAIYVGQAKNRKCVHTQNNNEMKDQECTTSQYARESGERARKIDIIER